MDIRNAYYINATDVNCEFYHDDLGEWLETTVIGGDPEQVEIRLALSQVSIAPIPDEIITQKQAEFAKNVRSESERRIYGAIPQNTILQLSAKLQLGILSTSEAATYRDGLAWIDSMKTAATMLILNQDESFAEKQHWPDVPENVALLVNLY